jgi:hypothetical protein
LAASRSPIDLHSANPRRQRCVVRAHADLNRQDPPEIVPSLIVMNSRAASLQDGKLTLTGVAPNSIVMNCLACRSLTEAAEPSAAKAA